MKKTVLLFISIFIIFALVACTGDSDKELSEDTAEEAKNEEMSEQENPQSEKIIGIADSFIEDIATGEYEAAGEHFDDTMKEELTPDALEDLWRTLQDQVGTYIDHEYSSTQEADGYQVVLLDGLFESSDVVFQVTFDDNQKIAGFFIH
ncbi:DUF3887 domain-containing protein [Gracilibacillus saliphilus]|uniref:DUF3887 domain-containing protein n=1 Tax=Gracilibacillus saliphilus TaxID=543890 RepID=UPI0013D2F30D|nr:DUF3887 domain-containing protein [Gracilibacillus saliphilus]